MANLSNHNSRATSPQQQQPDTLEAEHGSPFSQLEEKKTGNDKEETGNQVEVLATKENVMMCNTDETEDEDDDDDMHTENHKESDHQYFNEDMHTQQEVDEEEDDDDDDEGLGSELHKEELHKEEYDDAKSEEGGERDSAPSVITATQGSCVREDYISHMPTLPANYSCSKPPMAFPMVIDVQSEGSERDMDGNDEDRDDDSLSQRSTVADETEMFDVMRGNLGLLEQAIALKAQQVKAHRELSRIPEHHRFFPLDDRPSKHMEHLRKSCFGKGLNFLCIHLFFYRINIHIISTLSLCETVGLHRNV